jgi:hypothetical protein
MHLRPSIGCLILISAVGPSPLRAQTDQPSSTAPVTRAIAVYEWTGDLAHPTAARLLPVSLFINGQLEDAGVYLAQPIPFALQPGTLYLLQDTGQTVGALNIQSAHTNPTPSAPSWAAYGRFLTPTEAAAATAPPPPTTALTLPADTDAPTAPSKKEKKAKPAKQQAYVSPPTTPILDDPDRPILQANQPTAPATPPELTTLPPDLHQSAAISDATNRAPETFTYPWPSPATRDQVLQTLEAFALPPLTHYIAFNHLTPADDPKPTGPSSGLKAAGPQNSPSSRPDTAGPQDSPSSRPKRTARSGETPGFPTPTVTPTPELSSVAAPGSQASVLGSLGWPGGGPASPSSGESSGRHDAPTLTNPQLLAYLLTDTTTPTYVLTAELPLTNEGPLYLTLIAQPTAAGHLHLALVSITDATHLDRTPWLRPIDAVDPDATGRADLLFELRSQTTRQFALYTLTNTRPRQTLLTTPIE